MNDEKKKTRPHDGIALVVDRGPIQRRCLPLFSFRTCSADLATRTLTSHRCGKKKKLSGKRGLYKFFRIHRVQKKSSEKVKDEQIHVAAASPFLLLLHPRVRPFFPPLLPPLLLPPVLPPPPPVPADDSVAPAAAAAFAATAAAGAVVAAAAAPASDPPTAATSAAALSALPVACAATSHAARRSTRLTSESWSVANWRHCICVIIFERSRGRERS